MRLSHPLQIEQTLDDCVHYFDDFCFRKDLPAKLPSDLLFLEIECILLKGEIELSLIATVTDIFDSMCPN